MATKFETTECPRCGGTGAYSFNLMHGSRCYGCGGAGKVMTKRGKAAQNRFRKAISRPANEVQPGWLVWWPDVTLGKGKWVTVVDVRTFEYGQINGEPSMVTEFTTASGNKAGISASSLIRAVESIAQRDEAVAEALAYQATLGENGKPSKATKEAA